MSNHLRPPATVRTYNRNTSCGYIQHINDPEPLILDSYIEKYEAATSNGEIQRAPTDISASDPIEYPLSPSLPAITNQNSTGTDMNDDSQEINDAAETTYNSELLSETRHPISYKEVSALL